MGGAANRMLETMSALVIVLGERNVPFENIEICCGISSTLINVIAQIDDQIRACIGRPGNLPSFQGTIEGT